MNARQKKSTQNPLKMALRFLLKKNIATRSILNTRYLLNRVTLRRIGRGESLKKYAAERYFEVFVDIINDYRCRYPDDAKEHKEAKAVLFDMFLIAMGKLTETERGRENLMKGLK